MELLRELSELQHARGYLDDVTLAELAARRHIPLYRLEELVSFFPFFRRTPPRRHCVHVCRDVVCAMAGGDAQRAAWAERLRGRDDVELREVSCLGRCEAAPAASVGEHLEFPRNWHELEELLDGHTAPEGRAASDGRRWRCDPYAHPTDFYSGARALVAGQALPQRCIATLKEIQLRGMGGAGFPTGRKWELVASAPRQPKYVICNADESEPGTFKDRVILHDLPHLVLEGMLLAGLTVGAERGIIFLRHEYAPEQRRLDAALAHARAVGALGDNAAGSGRRFEVELFVSPGGYILGEETALLEALEDRRGEPRNKPPYPGQSGLYGQPTLINNVETLALAAVALSRGPEWWRHQGRPGFAGLKFLAVSGDVRHPGVYELAVGTTVREAIELAGGMLDDRPLKAFLPGGASSNFLPASRADTPLDFERLRAAGSMLGSGALIVMHAARPLFPLAVNLVRFFRNESCGKCVPCRLGTETAVEVLERVAGGRVAGSALAWLPELAETLEQTSICGLGQVALNPILSLLRHFPEEIPGHVRG